MTEPTNDARLEKIQGGVDLINERLKHSNELQNERHEVILKNIERLDAADVALRDEMTLAHAKLGGRVGALEARDNILVGERQGIGLAAKVLPFLGGSAVMAVVGLIARAAGL